MVQARCIKTCYAEVWRGKGNDDPVGMLFEKGDKVYTIDEADLEERGLLQYFKVMGEVPPEPEPVRPRKKSAAKE